MNQRHPELAQAAFHPRGDRVVHVLLSSHDLGEDPRVVGRREPPKQPAVPGARASVGGRAAQT